MYCRMLYDKNDLQKAEKRKFFKNDDLQSIHLLREEYSSSFFDKSKRDLEETRKEKEEKNRSSTPVSRDRSAIVFEEENRVSTVVFEDDLYKILINVDKYQELRIMTIDNNVIVKAKHEEITRDGCIFSTKSFTKSFILPRGVNPESVTASLSKSGILTISAPLPKTLK